MPKALPYCASWSWTERRGLDASLSSMARPLVELTKATLPSASRRTRTAPFASSLRSRRAAAAGSGSAAGCGVAKEAWGMLRLRAMAPASRVQRRVMYVSESGSPKA